MKVVSDFLRSEGLDGRAVLDVGGAAVGDVLQRYGNRRRDHAGPRPRADIVASATAIPRPDRSFDAVTCIDTLEHIPRELRLLVVDELVRVARTAVVIVAPLDTAENRAAESLVLRYTGERFLREHLANGLVDFAALRAHLEALAAAGRIRRFEYREIDDLLLWACLMWRDFASTSEVYEQLQWLDHSFHARRGALFVWCGPPEAR